jgi:hypothetical protein
MKCTVEIINAKIRSTNARQYGSQVILLHEVKQHVHFDEEKEEEGER